MTPIADSLSVPAHAYLKRQLRDHELDACSLDELSEARGSPEGRNPESWLRFAGDVLRGMSWRVAALEGGETYLGTGAPSAVETWPEDVELRKDRRAGSRLAIPTVGNLDALALDTPPDDPDRSPPDSVGRTTAATPTGPEPGG